MSEFEHISTILERVLEKNGILKLLESIHANTLKESKPFMNLDELSEYLSEVAPNAGVRYGDYPRREATLKVTTILSKLKRVDKVKQYYENTPVLIKKDKESDKKYEAEIEELINAAAVVPSLLGDDGH